MAHTDRLLAPDNEKMTSGNVSFIISTYLLYSILTLTLRALRKLPSIRTEKIACWLMKNGNYPKTLFQQTMVDTKL